MSDGKKLLLYLVIVAACISVAVWWRIYKYHDCRSVGHTKTYCILDSGD